MAPRLFPGDTLYIHQSDPARIAIHLNDLAVLELMGHVGNSANARLSVFPRYQCAMLKFATDFG